MRLVPKKLFYCFGVALCLILTSCGEDGPENPGGNNSSVTVNPDGSTSNGANFAMIDETTFFLDYIKYKIVDSHLEIVGYDPIELPADVKPYETVSIQGMSYKTRVVAKYAFYGCEQIKTLILPLTITEIQEGAFGWCAGLTSVQLPENLQIIGMGAFYCCEGLATINFPENLTSIGDSAFRGCTELTSIQLPENLQTISPGTFLGCKGLATIKFPKNLTSIGDSAFRGCTGLTSIQFPENLTNIEEFAFRDCTGLTSLHFPENLTSIERYTFEGCSGLTSIQLPENLQYVGTKSFYGCTGLKSITCLAKLPPMSPEPFIGYYEECSELYETIIVYVPSESLVSYKEKYCWCLFKNILPIK